ncbi:glycerophosphodiester phosphodiesterase [Polaromonas sp.]|jgi:glycerophosphoryl diester phosphodiesterase|uniref:glycerophosphodiester phosphodiesterase n=1 Tax=Polaromonas sp. TaxID=1869339 RepID=UPI0037C565D9
MSAPRFFHPHRRTRAWSARLVLLAGLCLPAAALAQPAERTIDVQGHRGARALAPENTLASFALALSLGVSTLELDIAITRDGVLVISHDPTLNPDITRGPDGSFLASRGPAISSLSYEELGRYDVGRIKPGTAYAKLYPEQRPVDGARIPRLSDLFDMVKKSGNEQVRFAIETKVSPLAPELTSSPEVFARAVVAAVREAKLASRTAILSFDWRTLKTVQQEAPDIPTVYLSMQQRGFDNIGEGQSEPSAWTAGLRYRDHGSVPRMIKAAGGHSWSAFHRDLSAAKVKEAQELGLKVLAWTVNEPSDIAGMLDLGVDSIVSDRPDRVFEALGRKGLKPLLPVSVPVPATR